MLALTRADAEYVSCFGSGRIAEDMIPIYNSPFAVETAHIKFHKSDVSARIIRSLFDTASQYRESIDVYGSKKSFEWPLIEGEEPVRQGQQSRSAEIAARVKVADDAAPPAEGRIQRFTTKGVYGEGEDHLSFTPRRRPRAAPTPATSPTSSSSALLAKREPVSRTRVSPPTGPARASSPTSPRWPAARSASLPASTLPGRRVRWVERLIC
jgi:hypothetical protein